MFSRVLLSCLLATWVGCGKRSSATPAPPEPKGAAEETATAPPPDSTAPEPSPQVVVADEAQIAAALGELTQVVRRFGVEQRRVPKTLDELVTQGYLSRVPEPPAGKKFAINPKLEVYLADR